MNKIYTLTIAHDDVTEEVEYIEEYVEKEESQAEFLMDYEKGYYSDEELISLIVNGEIGEA